MLELKRKTLNKLQCFFMRPNKSLLFCPSEAQGWKKTDLFVGIKKNINLRILRNSFEAQLMEAWTNLRYIQKLL